MATADTLLVEKQIKDICGMSPTWGGATVTKSLFDEAVTAARIQSGMEILRAVACNMKNGYWGSFAVPVTVAHNAFLPAHDGEPGIPIIVPYAGATSREGEPASPSQIDSWRSDPATSIYTGGYDGVKVAHDAVGGDGLMSPISARYSLINKRLKFTGYTAQVPLVQLTRSMADTGVPENYEPALVKLSIPKMIKPGDNLYTIAQQIGQLGQKDLADIIRGAMDVPPLPMVEVAQKAGVA